MVTQTEPEVETPEVDPEPPTTQTEEPEESTLPELAAEEPATAAADEGEAPLTRAEFERLMQEREAGIRQSAIEEARELERRERQAEEGRKAFERQQQAQLRDSVQVTLMRRLGVQEVEDDVVDDIIGRVRGIETSAVETRTVSAIDEAITAAAAKAVGLNPGALSPEASRYVDKFTGYMQRLLAHDVVREYVTREEKQKWAADLPKLFEAEKRKAAPKAPPIIRPDGKAPDTRTDAEIMADPNTSIEDLKAATARWQRR